MQLNLFRKVIEETTEDPYNRVCRECNKKKPDEDFESSKAGYRKRRNTCKECRTKSKQIRRRHRKNWGHPDENYKCPICETTLEGQIRNGNAWAVDHCHTTGKVRGYLCPTCNSGLGHLKDNPKILENAIEWLTKDEGEE